MFVYLTYNHYLSTLVPPPFDVRSNQIRKYLYLPSLFLF